jgi:hypothetical protein
MGKVFVTLVRQTETHLLELGAEVLPLARAARACLRRAPQLSDEQQRRLDTRLTVALEAHYRIERPSRRLTQGKAFVGDQIKGYGSDRRNMYSAVVPPGEVARGGIVTTIGHLAIFLASHLDGEERPHDHPGGLDGSESIGTARL